MNLGTWFRGLRGKLLLLIGIPLIALVTVGVLSLRGIATLSEDLTLVTAERLPLTHENGEMQTAYNAVARFLWRALAEDRNSEARKKALEGVEGNAKDFTDSLTLYQKLHLSDKGRTIIEGVARTWKDFSAVADEAETLLKTNTPEADAEVKALMLGKILKPATELHTLLEEAQSNADRVNKEIVERATKSSETVTFVSMLALALGFVLAGLIGVITANRLANNLNFIAGNISEGGTQVSTASEQMSAASQQLSSASTESASALQETVASVEELSSMVKVNADNAKEAAALSRESRTSAEEGESEIRKLNVAMDEVAKSSKKIEEIINVIDDIAFQTNLLALNAAVEAARAGDQGKGFAVVAEAVRALAQRSAAAAKDITGLIKESVVKVETGTKVATEGARTLKTIVTTVKKVADLNNEIAAASQEQSNGLAQISKAMNELDQATQRNASSAEETASASEELSGQAVTLQDLVGRLSLIIEGQTTVSAPAPVARRAAPQFNAKASFKANGKVVQMRPKNKPFPMEEAAAGDDVKIGTAEGF